MPDESETSLRHSVNHLTQVVRGLSDALDKEYPKRKEVEERFTDRRIARQRWLVVLVMIASSLPISAFATITIISGCFITDEPHARICTIIPGYAKSMENNQLILNEFQELKKTTERNSARLDELEQ